MYRQLILSYWELKSFLGDLIKEHNLSDNVEALDAMGLTNLMYQKEEVLEDEIPIYSFKSNWDEYATFPMLILYNFDEIEEHRRNIFFEKVVESDFKTS
jgi:hypothetical protein